MKIPDPIIFTASQAVQRKKLNRRLKPFGLKLAGNETETVEGVLLDTFDSAVVKSGSLLLQGRGRLILVQKDAGLLVEAAAPTDLSFAGQLPRGPLKDRLMALCPLRALLATGDVRMRQDTLRLLDDEQKTCCRLKYLTLKHDARAWTWMMTCPMRGYDKSHTVLASVLKEMDGGVAPMPALDLPVSDYTNKPAIQMAPDAPVKQIVCAIIRTFLEVARKNETGILGDLDTEFLHDFRVSLRKIRSVVTLFKGVFDAGTQDRLKQDFGDIMGQTGLLRDRDVYLLARQDYFDMVPPAMHPGLEILFTLLEKERRKAYESVCTMLKGESYLTSMANLRALFESEDNLASGTKAAEPSRELACRLVLKRYGKVCRVAKDITPDTPDEIIHGLRIQCKKLRYLIEAVKPIFDAKRTKTLIKRLKGLQEHLGNFNDYSVQQDTLSQFLESNSVKGKPGRLLAESIGALTAMLYRRQVEERNLIIENLSGFYSTQTREAFNELYA